jgi:hypothetical protein
MRRKRNMSVNLRVVQPDGLQRLMKAARLIGLQQQLDEKVLARLDARGVSMLELVEPGHLTDYLGLQYHRVRALVKLEDSELPELAVIDVLVSDWDELLTPSQFSERLERLRRVVLGMSDER